MPQSERTQFPIRRRNSTSKQYSHLPVQRASRGVNNKIQSNSTVALSFSTPTGDGGLAADGVDQSNSTTISPEVASTNTVACMNATDACFEGSEYRKLMTTYKGGNGSSGIMFNLVARNKLVMVSLDIHTDRTDSFPVEIWSRNGSFVDYICDSSSWVLVIKTEVQGAGSNTGTSVKIPPLVVDTDDVSAFYVYLPTQDLRYSDIDQLMGSVYGKNDDLEIQVGAGLIKHFSGTAEGRLFNGAFTYFLLPPGTELLTATAIISITGIDQTNLAPSLARFFECTTSNFLESHFYAINVAVEISSAIVQPLLTERVSRLLILKNNDSMGSLESKYASHRSLNNPNLLVNISITGKGAPDHLGNFTALVDDAFIREGDIFLSDLKEHIFFTNASFVETRAVYQLNADVSFHENTYVSQDENPAQNFTSLIIIVCGSIAAVSLLSCMIACILLYRKNRILEKVEKMNRYIDKSRNIRSDLSLPTLPRKSSGQLKEAGISYFPVPSDESKRNIEFANTSLEVCNENSLASSEPCGSKAVTERLSKEQPPHEQRPSTVQSSLDQPRYERRPSSPHERRQSAVQSSLDQEPHEQRPSAVQSSLDQLPHQRRTSTLHERRQSAIQSSLSQQPHEQRPSVVQSSLGPPPYERRPSAPHERRQSAVQSSLDQQPHGRRLSAPHERRPSTVQSSLDQPPYERRPSVPHERRPSTVQSSLDQELHEQRPSAPHERRPSVVQSSLGLPPNERRPSAPHERRQSAVQSSLDQQPHEQRPSIDRTSHKHTKRRSLAQNELQTSIAAQSSADETAEERRAPAMQLPKNSLLVKEQALSPNDLLLSRAVVPHQEQIDQRVRSSFALKYGQFLPQSGSSGVNGNLHRPSRRSSM